MSEPITIKWLKGRMEPCPANNFAWTEEEADKIADLAISQADTIKAQAEEIALLKLELEWFTGVDINGLNIEAELSKLKQERDEYAGVLAYYGNSRDIYHDKRNGEYALNTLEKYTGALKPSPDRPA